MGLKIQVDSKQDKFLIDEDKDAYLVYKTIFKDKMMSIYEKYGKYEKKDKLDSEQEQSKENLVEFVQNSEIEPMKEILGYTAIEFENVTTPDGEEIKTTGEKVFRVLAQTDRLEDYIQEIMPKDLGGEVKN